ncbi:Histone deacetylase [Gracilaria domingensis]|nr:Histone deacetylase [Gracilaria domingensis]
MLRGVVYVPPSTSFKALDSRLKHGKRSAVVHSLIRACGLESLCDVQPLRRATLSEALLAHSRHYLSVLYASSAHLHPEEEQKSTYSELDDFDFGNEEEAKMLLEEVGLIDDCATFPGVWELALLTVGGAVVAAQRLAAKQAKAACWFDGGRHHAMVDSAHGFCYLNDAVVACKVLLSHPGISNILYIDIDVHHGDGVEESFLYDEAVTTVSFHLAEKGFYPGTGHDVLPCQTPANHSALRVPLRRGIRNETYVALFNNVISTVYTYRQPNVFVLQCGCDGVAGDPLGGFNLTGEAYTARWGLWPSELRKGVDRCLANLRGV